ncbi:MAG: hypothetical protein OXL97_13660 [Chloroflexota bacterium]|nr:hypothetical protein [Chloroflexota bacterium]MDE2885284.1 hypothetical protein [Chloroflexota bacterium]
MSDFEAAYVLWVALSTLGVTQYTAVSSKLWGLVVLRRWPGVTRVCAAVIVIGAFAWFFIGEDRNLPDTGDGLDGVEQTQWFAAAAAISILLQIAVSSVVNHRWGASHGWDSAAERWPPSGLTWLEHTTFARALAARIRAVLGGSR